MQSISESLSAGYQMAYVVSIIQYVHLAIANAQEVNFFVRFQVAAEQPKHHSWLLQSNSSLREAFAWNCRQAKSQTESLRRTKSWS